ncbi:MAG: T9SS type A sorting domain-containing protein [Bacteroidetes bacterium]|nr:T9SS type A sorting domain-containing protein [Bacteroidota bacterium]
MKKLILLIVALFATTFFASAAAPVKTITGNISGNVMWNYDTIYLLSGKVYLINGATLTIAPGTVIKGDFSAAGSALIVTRGAKIYAIGEPTRPIVFTSSQTPGNRSTGDWGGLVIAGNAKVNVPGGMGTFEGGNLANPNVGGGGTADGQFGGLNDLDNSGELKYVRIEYAGFPYAPNNELNGLTMGGVGSGTKISYVQVSYGFDDSFEWFGGTVNCSHLISYRANDDDFDTDFGFRGRVQYGVALRDTAVADAVSGANCFESDNDATGTNLSPQTAPIFSNMTLVGPQFTPSTVINANFKRGAHIRRNSRESIFNSIFMGWPTGVHIDGDSCHRNADSLWLEVQNTVIAGSNKNLDSAGGAVWQVGSWFNNVTNNNTIYTANTSVMLTNPFNYTTPDFRPTGASPMLTGASFTNAKLGADFDQTPTFRGAFGATNWMDGWASFTADTNSYSDGIGPAIGSGINDLSNKVNSMEVYPNPAQNQTSVAFNLTTNAKVTCTVSDLSGKVLLTESKSMNVGRNEFSINTSMLNSGLYILKVGVGNSFNTTKLNVIKL